MREITREALKRKIERGDLFVLIEVLPACCYEDCHLPGAMNIPLGGDFDERVALALPDRGTMIVVYCRDFRSSDSPTAAARLEALGYHNVRRYYGGKADWRSAGLPTQPHRRNVTAVAAPAAPA
jgi:rhodanese-related sulfurtransferase